MSTYLEVRDRDRRTRGELGREILVQPLQLGGHAFEESFLELRAEIGVVAHPPEHRRNIAELIEYHVDTLNLILCLPAQVVLASEVAQDGRGLRKLRTIAALLVEIREVDERVLVLERLLLREPRVAVLVEFLLQRRPGVRTQEPDVRREATDLRDSRRRVRRYHRLRQTPDRSPSAYCI